MQLKWVFYICPVFIFFINKIPFLNYAKGWTPGPISLIINGSSEDIIQHELQHSRQFYRLWFIFWILYASPYFRLRFEAKAYAVQAKYILNNTKDNTLDNLINTFAMYMLNDYGLDYSIDDMKNIILYYYNK